jgi:hypothetical protein
MLEIVEVSPPQPHHAKGHDPISFVAGSPRFEEASFSGYPQVVERFAGRSVQSSTFTPLGIEGFAINRSRETATKLLWKPLTMSIPPASRRTARRRAEPLDGITLDIAVGYDRFTI